MPAQKFSIVVVGDGAVGKSAMTLRFLRDQFHDEYDPTIEDSYCKHIEVDGLEYTLDITDTAGQEEYRGHWNDSFMRSGDGFICVYSIASMGSFQELVGFRDQIWRAKESEYVPMVIAANKCDLTQEREVDIEVGQEFARMSNALYIETSAKTGINIHETILVLVQEIVKSRERMQRQFMTVDLKDELPSPAKARPYAKGTFSSSMTSRDKGATSMAEDDVESDGRDRKGGCCCIIM